MLYHICKIAFSPLCSLSLCSFVVFQSVQNKRPGNAGYPLPDPLRLKTQFRYLFPLEDVFLIYDTILMVMAEKPVGEFTPLANLERVNWTVDCVLTHCAPSGVVQKINPSYGTDELTDFLEAISQRCQFAYWFFGHYHENRIIDQKYILQWEKISELSF